MRRVGIYGGTFNPPHKGHMAAAKAFMKKAQLDDLIIMPAYLPPHKEISVSVDCAHRLEMCRLAFADISNARVSDLEISRGGKSYTYLTLQELTEDGVELYFLCGTDMILTMDSWKNPEIIFNLAKICYIRRETDESTGIQIDNKCKEYTERFGATVIPVDADVIEISSSEIRDNAELRSRYLADSVVEYIDRVGLYQ